MMNLYIHLYDFILLKLLSI